VVISRRVASLPTVLIEAVEEPARMYETLHRLFHADVSMFDYRLGRMVSLYSVQIKLQIVQSVRRPVTEWTVHCVRPSEPPIWCPVGGASNGAVTVTTAHHLLLPSTRLELYLCAPYTSSWCSNSLIAPPPRTSLSGMGRFLVPSPRGCNGRHSETARSVHVMWD
jgi:hypothetical protein